MPTIEELRTLQSKSLEEKVQISLGRIGEWYLRNENKCRVSFSGGKDSTVVSDLCAKWCKIIGQPLLLAYADTGLEYPEIRKHVLEFPKYIEKTYGIECKLDVIRPSMRFDEVIKKYGYPMISKEVSHIVYYAKKSEEKGRKSWATEMINGERMFGSQKSLYNIERYKELANVDFRISDICCAKMKKEPFDKFDKANGRLPITGQMASESRRRTQKWLKNGCNAFDVKHKVSNPISFWTEQDVLLYLKKGNMPIASVYGEIVYRDNDEQCRIEEDGCAICNGTLCTTGCDRTGCVFCGFGLHLEKGETRFERLKRTHPKQYAYCIGGGAYDEDGLWKPDKNGLGFGHVFDVLNEIYGEDFVRYGKE